MRLVAAGIAGASNRMKPLLPSMKGTKDASRTVSVFFMFFVDKNALRPPLPDPHAVVLQPHHIMLAALSMQ
jgi:hypothetical protein